MLPYRCYAYLSMALIGVGLMLSCDAPPATPTRIVYPATRTSVPYSTLEPSNSTPTLRVNLDAFAPPARGRDLLIFYCGNCHSFACGLTGQHTAVHWDTIQLTHLDRVGPGLADQDYEEIFLYLKANFDDTKPRPEVPSDIMGKGCTSPFR